MHATLFDTAPAKRRPGYANFAVAEPPLKLVLLEGEPERETRMDHLGIELASTDLVSAATDGLAEAGLSRARNRGPPAATPRRTRSGGDRTGRGTAGGVHRQGRRSPAPGGQDGPGPDLRRG